MRVILSSLLAALALMATTPAFAATLLFNLEGKSATGSFNIDSNPTPTSSGFDSFTAPISNGLGFFKDTKTLLFFSAQSGGGFGETGGPQLFSGSSGRPTILTGTFFLNNNGASSTITISEVAAAVPEPATWAMMLVGFAGIGSAMRRRKNKVTTIVSYA